MFGNSDKTDAILTKYLDKDFKCYASGENAPSKSVVISVASKLGVKVSKQFVAHSTGKMAGVYIEAKEEVWPRPKPFEVGPFWSFLYGLHVFGAAPDIPEWMDLNKYGSQFIKDTKIVALPILKVSGDANLYCFNENGVIVQYDHESNAITPVNLDFWSLLEREVSELRKRKDQKLNSKAK